MSLKSLLSDYYGGVRGDTTALAPYRQWASMQPKGLARFQLQNKWAQEKEAFTRNYYENMGIPQPVRAQKVPKERAPRRAKKPKKKDFVAQLISEGYPKSTANAQWRSMYPAKPRKPRADLENYNAYKVNRQANCIIKNDPHVKLAQRNLKDAISVAQARKKSELCRKYNKADNWINDDPFGLEMD
jgi:hypothetical protein